MIGLGSDKKFCGDIVYERKCFVTAIMQQIRVLTTKRELQWRRYSGCQGLSKGSWWHLRYFFNMDFSKLSSRIREIAKVAKKTNASPSKRMPLMPTSRLADMKKGTQRRPQRPGVTIMSFFFSKIVETAMLTTNLRRRGPPQHRADRQVDTWVSAVARYYTSVAS